MSKEYIEREAIIAKCVKMTACEWNRRGAPASWVDAYEEFVGDVLEIPAADVVEVVHGRWEWREEWDTDEATHTATLKSCGWYCTECGIELGDYLTKETGERHFIDDDFFTPQLKHCPNCGARMRGAEDE